MATVLTPHIDEDELQPVSDLAGSLTDFSYADSSVRHLELADGRLSGGRLTRIEAQRVTFDQMTFQSILVDRCVLSSSDWIDCTLSRVRFRECNILGANFRRQQLEQRRLRELPPRVRDPRLGPGKRANSLNGILINPTQRQELAEALVAELTLHYPDNEAQ